MLTNKRVLITRFDPKFLDFSSPELAPMNLTAEKVRPAPQRSSNVFEVWATNLMDASWISARRQRPSWRRSSAQKTTAA